MSEWPPTPNINTSSSKGSLETDHLEKTLTAYINEQRTARKWHVGLTLLKYTIVLLITLSLLNTCSNGAHSSLAVSEAVNPHVAIVDVLGEISADSYTNAEYVNQALVRAFDAKQSKVVVLNVNSPGGSPVESDLIWQEIKRLRKEYPNKKVYAVVGDMAASGAYYIASAADQIYVNPSSLVGSIGVIMPNVGVVGLAQKLGVEDRTLTAGTHKNMLSMSKPVNAEEVAHVQSVLDNVHQHFIKAVKQGRGKRLQENPDLFSGLFWSGEQAIGLGLADATGSVATVKREFNVEDTYNYTVEPDPLEGVLSKLGVSIGHGIASQFPLAAEHMGGSLQLK